jgi:DNA polymerase-3 subunit gamma/tau
VPEQALYLKWRPLRFAEVVGQEHITRTLRNSLKTGRIRHAYLFSGPRGTGKTTSARLLAKAVNCLHPDPDVRPCNECSHCVAVNEGRFLDLIEIDAASHTGVDDVRELRDRIAFAPGEGRYKVYIIDEVHRFSGNAFDALLKTLEEPPDHAIFVLATTEIDRVPATIKSRCLPFEFRRLSLKEVTDRLALITEQEGIKVERAALELIAREGTGSVRDSISLLDQVVADPQEVITLELTERILGTASTRAVRDLIAALLDRDAPRGLQVIHAAIDAGSDPRQFGQQAVEHLRAILLAQTASSDLLESSQEDRNLYQQQAKAIRRGELLKAIRTFNDAVNAYSGGWQPQLALELALIESLQEPETVIVQQVVTAAAPTAEPEHAPPTPTKPGTAPIIAPNMVSEKWADVQRIIYQNIAKAPDAMKTLPDLMQHAFVVTVDGNQLIMGVEKRLFLDKLNDPERIRWIQRGLLRVLGVDLLVKFVQSERRDMGEMRYATPSPDMLNDPLIQEAIELGGEIREDHE